ncbi:hypothetical protein ACIQU7_23420 [Streptomyces albidoflavus]
MNTATGTALSDGIDEVLMGIPLGEWITMPDVAEYVRARGLPPRTLTTVIRAGRRRGVLRTKKDELHVRHVMRVADTTRRPR